MATGLVGPLPVLGFAPTDGSVLYDNPTITSPWYDPPTNSIDIGGSVKDVPAAAINAGNLEILIDGQYVGTITAASAAQGEVWFEGRTPARVDPYWVQRSIVVELVDTTRDIVLARNQNLYYDLRREELASPSATPGTPAAISRAKRKRSSC